MHKRKSPSSLSELAIPLMRISPLHSVRKTHYGHPSLKAVVRTNLPRTTRSMATEVTVAGCYEADGSAHARFMDLAAGHGWHGPDAVYHLRTLLASGRRLSAPAVSIVRSASPAPGQRRGAPAPKRGLSAFDSRRCCLGPAGATPSTSARPSAAE